MSRLKYFLLERLVDVRAVLENPRRDPDQTAILIALTITAVLLVFLVGLAILALIRKRVRRAVAAAESPPAPEAPKTIKAKKVEKAEEAEKEKPVARLTPAERWLGTLAVGLVVGAALIYGTTYTARPDFCANCHSMKPSYTSWQESSHKDVTCNACHSRPGITGYLSRQVDFLQEGVVQARRGRPSLEASVANSACLRCHGDIQRGTLRTKALKVRHAEILAAGSRCTECHSAHSDERKKSMFRCIACHNGKQAASACATCHRTDIGVLAKPKRYLVKLNLPPVRKCSGCHAINKCTEHHGTEMPHQSGWLQEHGKIAASSNEPYCWRCHNRDKYVFCRRCHVAIPPHNLKEKPGWVEQHQFVVKGQSPSAIKACDVCHEVDFCGGCHGENGPAVFSLIQKE